jgi:hypothetical protein
MYWRNLRLAVVRADHLAALVAGQVQGRHQQRHQNGDDGDHHK